MAASVILSKCVDGRTFGVRIEKRENDWVRTWAFPIDEGKAKREGFDRTKIKGSLDATPEYPGCPYCGTETFVQCTCKKIGCYHESRAEEKSGNRQERKSKEKNADFYRCPWCNKVSKEIETVESFNVKSGGF